MLLLNTDCNKLIADFCQNNFKLKVYLSRGFPSQLLMNLIDLLQTVCIYANKGNHCCAHEKYFHVVCENLLQLLTTFSERKNFAYKNTV